MNAKKNKKINPLDVLNINVGVLGHVDSGKTTLVRRLSTLLSTAALDKHPQSQERGITLDLGFSAFVTSIPSHLQDNRKEENESIPFYKHLQVTLVDCPGHASLVRTIIGGAHIVDMAILVIDVTKGIQTQTTECLVIGEITTDKLIVVLNKMDLIPLSEQDEILNLRKLELKDALKLTRFQNVPILPLSSNDSNDKTNGIPLLFQTIQSMATLPQRQLNLPFLFAVDHCFGIKGKGTILTGTVLQGQISIGDPISFPSLRLEKKIKSMQMFHQPVSLIQQGDRAGICITGLDPSLMERGLVSALNTISLVSAVILKVHPVRFFHLECKSNSKMHITVGHSTVLANVIFFSKKLISKESMDINDSTYSSNEKEFSFDMEYSYDDSMDSQDSRHSTIQYALLRFEIPILCPPQSMIIASRLDTEIIKGSSYDSQCRLAFYGKTLESFETPQQWLNLGNKSQVETFSKTSLRTFSKLLGLSKLRIGKTKQRMGIVDKILTGTDSSPFSTCELIGRSMFKKETDFKSFLGLYVYLPTIKAYGGIHSRFGQGGKFKIQCFHISSSQFQQLKIGDPIILHFTKHLFDERKTIYQAPISKNGSDSMNDLQLHEIQSALPHSKEEEIEPKQELSNTPNNHQSITQSEFQDPRNHVPSSINVSSIVLGIDDSTMTRDNQPNTIISSPTKDIEAVEKTIEKSQGSFLRCGLIERLKGETTEDGRNPMVIVVNMFSDQDKISDYEGYIVKTDNPHEQGKIMKAFGKKGKVRIHFPTGTSKQPGDSVYLHAP